MIDNFDKKVYKPVNQCIYCGSYLDLTDEHILPYSLRGRSILRKASCVECAKITSKIESVIKEYRDIRNRLNIPSRHMDKNHKTQKFVIGSRDDIEEVESSSYPALLPMGEFELPGYLLGKTVSGINVNAIGIYQFNHEINEFVENNGHTLVEIKVKVANNFARMLGKIAYAYTVGELGYDVVKNSPLIGSILGKVNDIGTWVGTLANISNMRKEDEVVGVLHQMKIEEYDMASYLVKIQLFASFKTPIYGVVVKK